MPDTDTSTKPTIISKVDVPSGFPNAYVPFHAENYSFKIQTDSRRIRIYPNSFDISLENDTFFNGNSKHSVKQFLNGIPCVRIREYMQDSRIGQIVNWTKELKAGYQAGKDLFQNWDAINFQTLMSKLPEEFRNNMVGKTASVNLPNISSILKGKNDERIQMIDIPFIMYYQLMTAKQCGRYEIPYSGKVVDSSKGQDGWAQMKAETAGNFGAAMNYLLSNIKITTTPIWGGTQDNSYPQLEIKFDLFNDCMEGAINNYVFIQTIMAKNRYLQYNIFQQNPCIYDIEVKGYNRFFLCSGNFSCEYGGQSRTIPDSMLMEILLRMNRTVISQNISNDTLRELISIPDVYHLTFSFQPLLPNSLNNTLFRFMSTNQSMVMTDRDDAYNNVTTALGEAWQKSFNAAKTTSQSSQESSQEE